MATVRVCDRCLGRLGPDSALVSVAQGCGMRTYDVCYQCLTSLADWFASPPTPDRPAAYHCERINHA